MKPRSYTQQVHIDGAHMSRQTIGYPLPLPLFPTQFALVRPPDFVGLFDWQEKGWQVIHIKKGLRVSSVQKSKLSAKLSAMAALEAAFKKLGKKKVMARIGK